MSIDLNEAAHEVLAGQETHLRTLLRAREESVLRITDNSNGSLYINLFGPFYFSVNQLPGCCGAAIVHDFGYGAVPNAVLPEAVGIMERIAELAGYTLIMLTEVDDQSVFNATLEARNWKAIKDFVNARTDNTVQVWTKVLNPDSDRCPDCGCIDCECSYD